MCDSRGMKRKTGFMNFKLYKQIIDEASRIGVTSIRPQLWGEPLLHPKIVEMVKYARDKGLNVGFDTNGLLLNENMSRKLLKAGLNWIIFSFHGLTPEEYKKVHGVDAFYQVMNNIKTFCKIKKESNLTNPKTTVQTTIMGNNFKNVHKVFSLFKGVVDDFNITNCGYHPEKNMNDCRLIKFNYNRKIPCTSLFKVFAISWDGKVTVCCNDEDFKLSIGNVKDGISNLFESEKLNYYRKLHFLRKFKEMPLCSRCVDYATRDTCIPFNLRRDIIKGMKQTKKQ
jgi:radical SAM protein with 4Fe4S-binding SPASM domain